MAGILANSASHTMVSATADNTQAGYVTGERITLSATPTGTTYAWGIAAPSGSATGRSALSSSDAPSSTFIPDVGGYYVISCVVDGTAYVLRLAVAAAAIITSPGAISFVPTTDESVPAPTVGATLYYSSTQGGMALKLPDDSVATINTTAV